MEGKSKGLIAGGVDGGGYGSRPQTVAAEGLVPLPMAGDPTFYWTDLGASALKNNEGFRMGDLSVRTGEEFAAAFSHMAMKGRSGAEGRSVLHKMPLGKGAVEGELGNNNPFSYEEFAGTSGQMPLSRNPEISQMTGEKDRSTAEFRNDYGDVYSESGRAAQFFRAADESECRSDEFQRLPTSVHQEHPSGVGADDLTSHKVKFMCSFGGKILPRPSDGNLRYVGGETRIITVNRGIGFAELMQKMLDIYGQALLLKYQLPDEDLDALVSVSSDEDLENMMDEYGRLLEGSSEGSSRLRVFLFSATDSDLDHLAAIGDRRNSEQRYVDAVNGIAETGFTKHDDSITSVSSRHLENLIGLDVADNWNTTPWDPEGMSASLLSTKIIPQDVTNLGHPPPPNPSFSSKEAVAKAPSVTSSAPSSSPLSSLPNHLKQAGVGDISMQFLPEQNSKTGGNAYSVVRPPDGGGGYRDLDYGVTTLSTATSQNELRHRIAGPAREAGSPSKARHDYMLSPVSHPDSVYLADPLLNDTNLSGVDSHGKLNWQQEKFEVTQPMMDHRSDGQPPPLDSQRFVLQQPPPPVRWQQYVDAHQDTYGRADYIQHANSDGHVQQLFQQQSLQSPHVNNPQLSIHEGGVYRHANRAHPQHQDDLFGGPYLPKFIASHPLGQGVTTAAALQQMGSDPSSPRLAGRQIGSGQQHVQVHQQSNVPYSEQQSFGARVPYYNDQSNRALHPPSSPPQHHGQVFERVVRQHELPYEQLPHQQKTRPEQVPHADESCIHRQAMHHAHSETVLQEKVMKPVRPLYEGIQISQTHHSDGSARPVPSCAASSALQEGLTSYHGHQDMSGGGRSKISHQGKESQPIFSRESQPILSRQQGYTITHGGMEYRVEPPSSLPHFHERPNESDWVPQHRTQELDEAKVHFALRGRMAHTEEKGKEWSDELSGSCFAEPAVSFGGIGVSKDPNTLLGQGLGDSYQSHQQTEMFESLGASLCQLNQPVAAGDLGAIGILPDALQATRLYGKVNEVAASRPGLNGEEVRTADPAKEHVISSQAVSINSWLPGVTQGHMEERLAGIALNPYVYTTGVEPSIPSSMSTEWWGGNHGTDQAKVEASPSDLKQKGDSCGGQSRDALPFITNNETIILSDTYERLTLDEKSGNSMHISEQHPAESLRERITADDSGYLSYVPPDVTSNTRSLDKMKGGISDSAVVTLSESNSFCVPEQHVVQLQGKGIVDDDSGHSACVLIDVSPNTSSLDKLKEGDSHSVAATLPASISYSDSLRDLLKGSSASTTVPTSNTTEPLAKDDLLRRSNDPVSIGLLIEEDETSRELDSIKDGLSKGLPPEALLLSDKGEVQDHADEDVKGELENVAEDVKVQVHSSQEELIKGVDEETIPTLDLNFEEPNTDDVDKDEPDAVIKEAISHGLQTIKNADLEELRELGSGTFGTVYHGKWRGSDVAIKRIKNSCFMGKPSEQERLRADFWREACMLAQLHHPNVVAFYGVVPDGPGGTLATVTEYMVNGSLKQVMHRKDRMIDRRKRLLIAMDAAFGMEYLHGKNIVHFDLKCENLLVNMRDPQRPICKVGDLGLSKIKHQTLVSGGVRGTLPWMAPELLNGSSSMVSEKVDVFSFGIVMWELLTGEEPYANMHYGAIIGGIVNNTLRPPIPNWCDTAWRSLMEHCWSADPSARPSFTEITNALRAMAASLPPKGQGHQAHPQVHAQS